MNQSINRFQDVHMHACAVRDWNQTYSQISAGPLESSLMQLKSTRTHVFRERISQRVVQHGEAPKGKMCFAIPTAVSGAIRMQGREADENSIFVLRGGEEFMFHMPMGMDMLSITFDGELFESALEATPSPGDIRTLLRQPVIKVPSKRLAQCRDQLLALFLSALAMDPLESSGASGASGAAGSSNDGPDLERSLEQEMLDGLLQLLTDPTCDRNQRPGSSTQSFIVDKCHRLTVSDAANAPSVIELCQRLQISRRTVQNSFRTVAETTPVKYLRSVRLNGVRRELMATRASDLAIGDAAANWGFFHMSHFAADYQELFGELPSQTRRGGR
jgi:AraC-like DNA-binding protein